MWRFYEAPQGLRKETLLRQRHGPCRDMDRIHSQQVLLEVGSGRLRKGVSLDPWLLEGSQQQSCLAPHSGLCCISYPCGSASVCSAAPARFPAASPSPHRFLLCIPLLYLWLPVLPEFPLKQNKNEQKQKTKTQEQEFGPAHPCLDGVVLPVDITDHCSALAGWAWVRCCLRPS